MFVNRAYTSEAGHMDVSPKAETAKAGMLPVSPLLIFLVAGNLYCRVQPFFGFSLDRMASDASLQQSENSRCRPGFVSSSGVICLQTFVRMIAAIFGCKL